MAPSIFRRAVVHSVAMCLICGFGLLLSDDRGSKALKQIVEQQSLGQIDIYNRQEVFDRCKGFAVSHGQTAKPLHIRCWIKL